MHHRSCTQLSHWTIFKNEKGYRQPNFAFRCQRPNVFGFESGTQINELGLLARGTFVAVDKDNKIVHIQRVPELTMIPDLDKLLR
ncbi:hypothetical protein OH492_08745 [Vibrio chagasii]|nr:hypothetical protein [Vibrio chagasii]